MSQSIKNPWWLTALILGLALSPAALAEDGPAPQPAATEAVAATQAQDDGGLPGETSKVSESMSDSEATGSSFWANYYGILYGPSVSDPSSFQSTTGGQRDPNRPVFVKNFLTAGFNISDHVAAAATGWWNYIPVQGGDMFMQDPSVRLAYNDIVHTNHFNWYGDIRGYIPISKPSRQTDLRGGYQTFHYLSYILPNAPVTFGSYFAARYNQFGAHGSGDDLQLYLAPALSYQSSPTLALVALYEFSENHAYGAKPFAMYNDGTVFEPGVEWNVAQSLTLNPYFYIYTNAPSNTGLGATLSWLMF
ncbi:MAG: hypothetical protein P4M08_07910 [Oligoflexia bacterium]|nr:hypothetical protein [Oligoflexia bacterium]